MWSRISQFFLTLDEYLYMYLNSNDPSYKLNVSPFIFMFYSIRHIISSFFLNNKKYIFLKRPRFIENSVNVPNILNKKFHCFRIVTFKTQKLDAIDILAFNRKISWAFLWREWQSNRGDGRIWESLRASQTETKGGRWRSQQISAM